MEPRHLGSPYSHTLPSLRKQVPRVPASPACTYTVLPKLRESRCLGPRAWQWVSVSITLAPVPKCLVASYCIWFLLYSAASQPPPLHPRAECIQALFCFVMFCCPLVQYPGVPSSGVGPRHLHTLLNSAIFQPHHCRAGCIWALNNLFPYPVISSCPLLSQPRTGLIQALNKVSPCFVQCSCPLSPNLRIGCTCLLNNLSLCLSRTHSRAGCIWTLNKLTPYPVIFSHLPATPPQSSVNLDTEQAVSTLCSMQASPFPKPKAGCTWTPNKQSPGFIILCHLLATPSQSSAHLGIKQVDSMPCYTQPPCPKARCRLGTEQGAGGGMWCPPATDATSPLVPQNPDYHGFHDDPVVDLWNMRIVFFFSVSVCIVIGFTLMHYMPDNGMQEWARREAERLVRQREAQGLPVLDPNYYDPKTLVFPPQDED